MAPDPQARSGKASAMPPHGSDLTGPRSDSGPFEIFGSAIGPIRSPKVPF